MRVFLLVRKGLYNLLWGELKQQKNVNQRPMCTTHSRVMWATRRRVMCAIAIEAIVFRAVT